MLGSGKVKEVYKIPLSPSFFHEQDIARRDSKIRFIGGIDEVGRGCLAGPVVAACGVFETFESHGSMDFLAYLKNSKELTSKQRVDFYKKLKKCIFFRYALGWATALEIDQVNILQATFLAMQRAYKNLNIPLDAVLVDGPYVPVLDVPAIPLVKGDQKSLSIAAASICAKVVRDRYMQMLDVKHPYYHWKKNKGYATTKHREMLRCYGVSSYHRFSFRLLTS